MIGEYIVDTSIILTIIISALRFKCQNRPTQSWQSSLSCSSARPTPTDSTPPQREIKFKRYDCTCRTTSILSVSTSALASTKSSSSSTLSSDSGIRCSSSGRRKTGIRKKSRFWSIWSVSSTSGTFSTSRRSKTTPGDVFLCSSLADQPTTANSSGCPYPSTQSTAALGTPRNKLCCGRFSRKLSINPGRLTTTTSVHAGTKLPRFSTRDRTATAISFGPPKSSRRSGSPPSALFSVASGARRRISSSSKAFVTTAKNGVISQNSWKSSALKTESKIAFLVSLIRKLTLAWAKKKLSSPKKNSSLGLSEKSRRL